MKKTKEELPKASLFPEALFEDMLSSNEELMIIRGGREDSVTCGAGCGDNCGSNCGESCGSVCGSGCGSGCRG